MNVETLAKKLNGINRRDGIDNELTSEAKAGGLVIVRGESDDLMEFRGAIYDEVGAYDGGSAFVTNEGLVTSECDEGEDCPYYQKELKKAQEIKAIWDTETEGGEKTTWLIKTDIPHQQFRMIDEDDNLFCVGLVFSLADVKAKN